jgi:hypothetical protein
MPQNVVLSPSRRLEKKWSVKVGDTTVHFGAKGYQDFTMHKDENRKKLYIQRHQANEDWKNVKTAGFWSRWLLWNKPTIQQSIDDIQKRFSLNILRGKISDGKKKSTRTKKKSNKIKLKKSL